MTAAAVPLVTLALLLLAILPAPAALAASEPRTFTIEYDVTLDPVATDAGPLHVFVPLPRDDRDQEVLRLEIDAPIPGAIETEPRYGNRFWHGSLPRGNGEPLEIRVRADVARRVARRVPAPGSGRALTELERAEHALFLGENARVVVRHPVLEPIRREVRAQAASAAPTDVSRAIYDWVVDNVEYKKVGTGWGNGDTFWACSERYGNCTDFHALFISLARSEDIPARFEMGFPVPLDRSEGQISGYHCWVQFHLGGIGWVPIDASEASKQPALRERFYGQHPPDRVLFTRGRDLRLGPDHRGPALNYFIDPHVEVGGEPLRSGVARTVRFRALDAAPLLHGG